MTVFEYDEAERQPAPDLEAALAEALPCIQSRTPLSHCGVHGQDYHHDDCPARHRAAILPLLAGRARDDPAGPPEGLREAVEAACSALPEYIGACPVRGPEPVAMTPKPDMLAAVLAALSGLRWESAAEAARPRPGADAVSARRVRLEDGTLWPDPMEVGEVAWRLVHAPDEVSRADELLAASVIDCYTQVVLRTDFRRKPTMIRRALNKERNEGSLTGIE